MKEHKEREQVKVEKLKSKKILNRMRKCQWSKEMRQHKERDTVKEECNGRRQ